MQEIPSGRLAEARQRAGLSQVALAVRADVSLATISIAERTNFASQRTIEKLAGALGVAVDVLRPKPKGGAPATR